MTGGLTSFEVGHLYSNEEVFKALSVGNTGGVRVKTNSAGSVERLAIFTALATPRQLLENPYHDRLEGEVLTYTGAGRVGDQMVSGVNSRLVQQQAQWFPIFGFAQVGSRRDKSVGAKRWAFLGLLEALRGYREKQIDKDGQLRKVWMFELRVNTDPDIVHIATAQHQMRQILARRADEISLDDREVANIDEQEVAPDFSVLEPIRKRLLSLDPRQFEHAIKSLLEQSGFDRVEVTQYSQDGGIDVNARPGKMSWPMAGLLVQVQAKRWLHTVGRREVAELRGSLQAHAAGCIVTTSHFSRAALSESNEAGKVPITMIDGLELAHVVNSLKLRLD